MDEFDWGSLLDSFGGDSIPSIDYSNLLDAFGGIDLSNVDLTGGNLSNIDLSNIDLGGFNLSDYASLADAFGGTSNIDLSNVDFGGKFSTADYSDLADAFGSGDTSGIAQLLDTGTTDTNLPTSSVTTLKELQDAGIVIPTTTDQSPWTDVGGLNVLEEDLPALEDTGTIDNIFDPYKGLGYTDQEIKQLQEGTYSGPEQTPDQVKEQLGPDLYPLYEESIATTEEALKDKYWKDTLKTSDAKSGTGTITTDSKGNTVVRYPDGTSKILSGPGGEVLGHDGKIINESKSGSTKNPIADLLNKITGVPTKDNALLLALLGGLLGLLNRKPTATGPVGYQGGIPKYTAIRGTPTSPTAGGRTAGGAGIGSLTGGVSYTKAAHGGLMGLKQGQYLRGATGGMEDKINTTIGESQPAKLSHGEFVLPSDIVSALGQGNSEAGADVLYDMMDRIRQKAFGRKKQITPIKPKEVLPA